MYNDKEMWTTVKIDGVKPMYKVSSHGNILNEKTGNYLHPWKGKNGYLFVSLMRDDGTTLKIGMHNLVAIHFIKVPKYLRKLNEPIVPNHNDFNKENNHYKNLQWMTYAMNNQWNIDHGHCKVGEDCPNAKVSNIKVEMICKYMEEGFSNKDILSKLNFDNNRYYKALLTSIRTGSKWKSISSKYNIENKNTLRRNTPEFVEEICKLLEKSYSIKEMRKELNIPDVDKEKFKKLVWFIRTRKTYKDISINYVW